MSSLLPSQIYSFLIKRQAYLDNFVDLLAYIARADVTPLWQRSGKQVKHLHTECLQVTVKELTWSPSCTGGCGTVHFGTVRLQYASDWYCTDAVGYGLARHGTVTVRYRCGCDTVTKSILLRKARRLVFEMSFGPRRVE